MVIYGFQNKLVGSLYIPVVARGTPAPRHPQHVPDAGVNCNPITQIADTITARRCKRPDALRYVTFSIEGCAWAFSEIEFKTSPTELAEVGQSPSGGSREPANALGAKMGCRDRAGWCRRPRRWRNSATRSKRFFSATPAAGPASRPKAGSMPPKLSKRRHSAAWPYYDTIWGGDQRPEGTYRLARSKNIIDSAWPRGPFARIRPLATVIPVGRRFQRTFVPWSNPPTLVSASAARLASAR